MKVLMLQAREEAIRPAEFHVATNTYNMYTYIYIYMYIHICVYIYI